MRFITKVGMAAAAAGLIASLGALSASAADAGTVIAVESSADEVRTGLNVVKAREWSLMVRTSRSGPAGTWSSMSSLTAAASLPVMTSFRCPSMAPDAPVGGLVYRIGDGKWAAASPYQELPDAMTSGELVLAVNDVPGYRHDNTGSFEVKVQQGFDIAN